MNFTIKSNRKPDHEKDQRHVLRNKGPVHKVWKEEYVVEAVLLAQQGKTNEEMAKHFGVSMGVFSTDWLAERPLFRFAVDRGKEEYRKAKDKDTLKTYMEKRLSPRLRRIWDSIILWHESAKGPDLIDELMKPLGNKAKQSLWIHAMLQTQFDASKACRMIGVPLSAIEAWKNEDPNFQLLVEEVEEHKNNFFETALIDLVRARDARAVIFANEARNRKRGYGKKSEVEVSGTITLQHVVIPLESLDVSMATMLELEKALLKRKAELDKDAIPVESQRVEKGKEASRVHAHLGLGLEDRGGEDDED
jgi:hypothetical protein